MSSYKKENNVPEGPNNKNNLRFETLQLHAGQETPDSATDSRAVPIYLTTSYVFKDCKTAADRFALKAFGNIYGRITNSTQDVFEARMAALEGGTAALSLASGAAAVTYIIQNLTKTGDHIVAANNLYGGTYNLLRHTFPRSGVETTFVDPDKVDNFEKVIKENTKAIFIEIIGNPNSNLIDVEAMAALAHKYKIPLIVDNTFATPFLFRPLEHGADIVIESATKFICGHGTVMGGVVIEGGKFDWKASGKFPHFVTPDESYHGVNFYEAFGPIAFCIRMRVVLLRDCGATISPVTAFTLLQGLESLSYRMERHVENTLKVVEYLKSHPKIEKINHPSLPDHAEHALYNRYFPNGACSIFTVDIKGGLESTQRFCESLKIIGLIVNVGDSKSIITHPATTTHSQSSEQELKEQKININTVRLSIGLENIHDLIADFDQALNKV